MRISILVHPSEKKERTSKTTIKKFHRLAETDKGSCADDELGYELGFAYDSGFCELL